MALIDSKQLNPRFTGSFVLSGSSQTFDGLAEFKGASDFSGSLKISGSTLTANTLLTSSTAILTNNIQNGYR